ncbi:MAG: hypothetical protein ACXABY_00610 [Candidatus Thorarchaeota archaeon]|jgi:hypothetical protein
MVTGCFMALVMEAVKKRKKYAYHTTTWSNLEAIREKGLVTSGKGMLWFCSSPKHYRVRKASRDVQLRFPWPKDTKGEGAPSHLDPVEYSTRVSVPTSKIDVKIKGRWIPLEKKNK